MSPQQSAVGVLALRSPLLLPKGTSPRQLIFPRSRDAAAFSSLSTFCEPHRVWASDGAEHPCEAAVIKMVIIWMNTLRAKYVFKIKNK